MSEVAALSFLRVFDKSLIVHLMSYLAPSDVIQFGMVCRITRSYYHQYMEETVVPVLHKTLNRISETVVPISHDKVGKDVSMSSLFIDLVRGFYIDHTTPFSNLPKMRDYWKTLDMSRVIVYQSMVHVHKEQPRCYIDKAPEGIEAPVKEISLPDTFDLRHYYHNRAPFRYSCLLKEVPVVYITSNCILPLPGLYECWVQLYFFTDSHLPFLNVEILGSTTVKCEILTKRINFLNEEGKQRVGCVNTLVGIFHTHVPRSHAVLRLLNLDVTQGSYARVALDHVMYVPVSAPSRKRKFAG